MRKNPDRSADALRVAEERLAAILATIDNVVWSISATTFETLYLNAAAERVYGRGAAAFYDDPELFLDIVHPEDRPRLQRMLPDLLRKGCETIEYRVVRPDGEVRWLEDKVVVARDGRGCAVRFDGVASDVTERKAVEARLQYLATHDALTGLPNRNLLGDRVGQAVAQAHRDGRAFGVLLLDLDRFKLINDGFGHAFGDGLLLALAARLRGAVRECDTVARLGGDEFVILMAPVDDPEQLVSGVRRLLEAFAAPFTVHDSAIHASTSIGIAMFPTDGDNWETLLKNADAALYRAKELGRNGFQFFAREMSAQATRRLELENALRQAVERDELVLHYQPQLDIRSGRMVAVEALLRWHHPRLGLLAPDEFIRIAEETGLIVPIGAWVLGAACAQNRAWQDAGLPRLRMCVNISAKQFWEGRILQTVECVLADTGLAAADLELEVTETVFLRDIDETVRTIAALRAMGVAVSMDDFGTGYSSLNYLRRLPIETLKIDGSFIRDLATVPTAAVLLSQIIHLAHAIGLKVVAEGVETESELKFLSDNQCDVVQGFHVHEPLAPGDFGKLLESL